MKNILKELRVKHYIKNMLVFFPLVFSLNLLSLPQVLMSFYIFIAFCTGSSAVYVVNDIADAPRDRLHPDKKNRPIASGAISIRQGAVMVAISLGLAFALGFWASTDAGLFLTAYIAVNALYSFRLKRYAILDVFCIMTGFVLRVAAGAAAIGVPVSSWLLLTVMSLSLFMGFGKRRGEMRKSSLGGERGGTRIVLEKYTDAFLDKSMYTMMTLSITFYTLWSIDSEVISHTGTDKLVWTVPLAVAGILRYAQITEGNRSDGDPTNVILADKPVCIIIAALAVAVTAVIYIH